MASPITTRLLRFNHRYKTTTLHHFSTTIPTNPLPQPEPESKPNSPFTDYIKSTLHNQQQPPRTQLYQQNQNPISHNQQTNHFPQRNQQPNFLNQPRTDFSFRNQSIDDISQSEPFRKVYQNLSQFSSRTAQPPPSSKQQVSFSNLFKQSTQNAIKPNDFRSRFKDNLNTPSNGAPGGGFGSSGMGFNMGLGFTRKPEELGRKLRELRPEKRMGEWFSLQELSDRLVKLKEIEEKEKTGVGYDLRNVMITLRDNKAEEEKMKRRIVQKLDTLSNIGGTPSYMLHPPKEDLLDQYFHPDNMSSAEKMKLELKKVRDEFKMSDSDCGSARVQVAQLTTKIKHLSTVLAKKDKHSRKGLQAMVQKRKKLLKYLRRTDWDSYSLVLSKLGLRDNPDIKA